MVREKRRCSVEPRPRRKCASEMARETYLQDGVAAATAEAHAVKVHGNDTGLLPSE